MKNEVLYLFLYIYLNQITKLEIRRNLIVLCNVLLINYIHIFINCENKLLQKHN